MNVFRKTQAARKHLYNSQYDIVPEVPVTQDFVRNITGIEDKDTIRIILSTGASRYDIVQAYETYFETYHTRPVFVRPMSALAQQVYDILDYIRLVPE